MNESSPSRKSIALVAHDNCKIDLVEWAAYNRHNLLDHHLVATGTTGSVLTHEVGLEVTRVNSGPLGGDLQIGAMVAEGTVDMLIFFWDPLEPQPHDPDVKALLRIATLRNIPAACNRATADFLISSPMATTDYQQSRAPLTNPRALPLERAS
ncbi:MAG: methylglyoxal synthase [Nitriliruptoraceae bacterium]